MVKLFFAVFGLILFIVWIFLFIPQYKAARNKYYRTVAIFLTAFVVSAGSLIAMIIYGDFFSLISDEPVETSAEREIILCFLGAVSVWGHFFCLWFSYFRKSWDYIRIDGHSDKEIRRMIDPEIKRLLGYPQ